MYKRQEVGQNLPSSYIYTQPPCSLTATTSYYQQQAAEDSRYTSFHPPASTSQQQHTSTHQHCQAMNTSSWVPTAFQTTDGITWDATNTNTACQNSCFIGTASVGQQQLFPFSNTEELDFYPEFESGGTSFANGGSPRSSHRPEMRQSFHDWARSTSYRINPQTGKTRTKDKYRVVYSDHQRLELEKEFHYCRYITIKRKGELASCLGLSERQVKIWFQNRRAKDRKNNKKRNALGNETTGDKQHEAPSSSNDGDILLTPVIKQEAIYEEEAVRRPATTAASGGTVPQITCKSPSPEEVAISRTTTLSHHDHGLLDAESITQQQLTGACLFQTLPTHPPTRQTSLALLNTMPTLRYTK